MKDMVDLYENVFRLVGLGKLVGIEFTMVLVQRLNLAGSLKPKPALRQGH